ncbi:hypothetical protein [Methylomonas albis]|uniref:Uncharacterized protein n=1 Tax=Methylomonas albis TaxID=1854563 RepID=A0ABR9D556_9GAMM|nr:hypothetical protein [Methylomonas albis]MBD9358060.1 hypothetical protein [Methylomonas albis]CAD6881419.1 hypothetical protein [Methylomonas albis]
MGDIQNSTVLLAALALFFAADMPPTIRQHFLQQQQDLIGAFMRYREDIFGFWRQGAGERLPWETEISN